MRATLSSIFQAIFLSVPPLGISPRRPLCAPSLVLESGECALTSGACEGRAGQCSACLGGGDERIQATVIAHHAQASWGLQAFCLLPARHPKAAKCRLL
ncbi:hypothetical protein EX30DRAFT_146244 [Ascodesmis nigricans]|uniref:Uncharacterized protein n=1 Tax=Ascodesmis nigricans TaxID=341454 RepID=A0A4S2N1Z4_9PEZI|nr:hypothetical protein EX30DRAFT_146244 [Ascodesmis nigricans]